MLYYLYISTFVLHFSFTFQNQTLLFFFVMLHICEWYVLITSCNFSNCSFAYISIYKRLDSFSALFQKNFRFPSLCSFQRTLFGLIFQTNGDKEIRTLDPLLARQVLSQLSYTPKFYLVGLNGLEPSTSRLSGVRSNQLSYRPMKTSQN